MYNHKKQTSQRKVNQVVMKKLRKKLQKNLVDWKSRCNFAACLTINNKKRRNERREDIYQKERSKEACKFIQGERSHGIYGTQIR